MGAARNPVRGVRPLSRAGLRFRTRTCERCGRHAHYEAGDPGRRFPCRGRAARARLSARRGDVSPCLVSAAMALLIASDMHKDMAGQPLLRGVSFKLERRERMTIAGRNGAGKTTLLRMLAGETSIDRGELSVAKGVRIALHDQRPPRERDAGAARLCAVGLRRGARDRGRAGRSRAPHDGRRRR